MKRKFFIAIAGLALVFAMALVGCTAPISDVSLEKTDTPPSLSGPSNVTARAYEGTILLTWDPVPDATGYKIFRKDNTENISTAIEVASGEYKIGTQRTLYYRDTATFDGNLINDHSYTYTVYSLSGMDPTTAAATSFIGNGHTSSNAVTAKVPERTVVDWITVGEVSVEPLVDPLNNSKSEFLVSWDAKPNLKYQVRYSLGNGTAIGQINGVPILPTMNYPYGSTGYSPLNPRASVRLPITGGENTISVVASFIGDTTYYSKIAVNTQTETLAKSGLSAPQNLSATRNETTVTLRWNDIAGADAYEVYKAPYNEATEEVTGDWTKVTLSAAPNKFLNGWIASELNVSKESYYYYTVIATKKDGTKSHASNAAPLALDNINIGYVNVQTSGDTGLSARLIWPRLPDDANVTYTLFRAWVTFKSVEENYSDSDISAFGPMTSVAVDRSKFTTSQGIVDDTSIPATNTYYVYMLVAKKGNRESTTYALLYEKGAYCKLSRYYLESNASNYHNAVALTLKNFYDYNSGAVHGVKEVDLYKQTGSGVSTRVHTFTNSVAWESFVDTDVTSGNSYRYTIEVKDVADEIVAGWENDSYKGNYYPSSVSEANVGSASFSSYIYPIDRTPTSVKLVFSGSHLAKAHVKIEISSDGGSTYESAIEDAEIERDARTGQFYYTVNGLSEAAYYIRVSRDNDITISSIYISPAP
jgi:hypothetical protein